MQDARATRKDIHPIGKKNPNLPFHPAVRAGDFIFVSGQVAKDADGNMISGTIEEETQGTIEAIRRILAEEGATLSDVVRVTTYLGDARDFGRYNRVFGEHFKDACWHARPSRHGRSSIPKSKWTPLRTSRVAGELVVYAAHLPRRM
jgi:2-iminobutanoate/2-iminopropanoate deaminase